MGILYYTQENMQVPSTAMKSPPHPKEGMGVRGLGCLKLTGSEHPEKLQAGHLRVSAELLNLFGEYDKLHHSCQDFDRPMRLRSLHTEHKVVYRHHQRRKWLPEYLHKDKETEKERDKA